MCITSIFFVVFPPTFLFSILILIQVSQLSHKYFRPPGSSQLLLQLCYCKAEAAIDTETNGPGRGQVKCYLQNLAVREVWSTAFSLLILGLNDQEGLQFCQFLECKCFYPGSIEATNLKFLNGGWEETLSSSPLRSISVTQTQDVGIAQEHRRHQMIRRNWEAMSFEYLMLL